MLDLAAWAPVRRRFGFDDDELERLTGWAVRRPAPAGGWTPSTAGRVRAGRVSAEHLAGGLDRILLGVAMADEDNNRLGTALPLDDVGSSDVDLAGRLAELLARLTTAAGCADRRASGSGWLTALLAERSTA